MGAGAEGQVPILSAADVQPFGVGKLHRIPIRRAETEHDEVALCDPLAADLAVGGRRPPGELDRALVAQELIDGGLHECRIVL